MQDLNNLHELWLVRTNQIWKLGVFMFLMFLGMVIFVGMIMVINKAWMPTWISEFELSISGIFIVLSALIWFCKSIKCSKCGYKPVWPILRTAPANEWLAQITKLEECPSCKDKGENQS